MKKFYKFLVFIIFLIPIFALYKYIFIDEEYYKNLTDEYDNQLQKALDLVSK